MLGTYANVPLTATLYGLDPTGTDPTTTGAVDEETSTTVSVLEAIFGMYANVPEVARNAGAASTAVVLTRIGSPMENGPTGS